MKITCGISIVSVFLLLCSGQAQAGSSARMLTTFGQISSSDSPWTVRVSASDRTFRISYTDNSVTNVSGTITVGPASDWRAKPGWFVLVENNQRVWLYDGGTRLLLQVAKPAKRGTRCTTYGPDNFPCPVPEEVLARLSPEARRLIRNDK